MNGAIANQPSEYYPIFPSVFQRKRTAECEKNALEVLKSYLYYRYISEEEYEIIKKEIESAPHDDAISNRMTRLRKRVLN